MGIVNNDIQSQSKQDFLKEMEKYYDENVQEDIMDVYLDPENHINVDSVMETFNFLNRYIYIEKEIDVSMANIIIDMVRFYNKVDRINETPEDERIPIKIFINTPGGDLNATFSIIDTINTSKTPVWTIATGSASSGGFFILINGHKRFAYEHSTFLFHEGYGEEGGDAHKFLQWAKFYERRLKSLRSMVIDKTRITEEAYEKIKKDDLWLDSKEALELKIIDCIVEEDMF